MSNGVYYQTSNNYKRDKNTGANNNKILIMIMILLVSILAVFMYVRSNQMQIIQADYGEVIDGFETRALVVRREEVFTSPVAGRLELTIGEGVRVNYGQKVAEITNENDTIQLYCKKTGLISYAVDGLEEKLQPFRLDGLNLEEFSGLERNFSQQGNGSMVSKREAVYRIVDNFLLYIVIQTGAEEARRYRTGELVFIDTLNFKSPLIKGVINRKKIEEKEALLFISLDRFVEEWLNTRWAQIEFIKNIHRGIVIPREAIFSQPAGEGVLLYSSSGQVVFKEIGVVKSDGEQTVVTGLEAGDRVICNPEAYNYGRGG